MILDDDVSALGKAELPTLNYLDQFTGRAKAQTLFEAVGYGLEKSLPIGAWGGDTRMKSQQVIINSKGVYGIHDKSSIVFSNNNGKPHRGGTCSGDSGGPFFRNNTNLQVAVNSYGVPPNCTGGDGAYRIDQPDDLEWLHTVLGGTDLTSRSDAGFGLEARFPTRRAGLFVLRAPRCPGRSARLDSRHGEHRPRLLAPHVRLLARLDPSIERVWRRGGCATWCSW